MKIRCSCHIRVTNDTISFSLFYVTYAALCLMRVFYRIMSEKVFGCYVTQCAQIHFYKSNTR